MLGTAEVSSLNSIYTDLCSQKLGRVIFLALELWAGGCCGAGTPRPRDIPPKFLSTTCGCGTSLFHISTPYTSLDGCGFFNFVFVGLPLNPIPDSSKWWLFYSLVVILTWLCKEESCVYLCSRLGLIGDSHMTRLSQMWCQMVIFQILSFLLCLLIVFSYKKEVTLIPHSFVSIFLYHYGLMDFYLIFSEL